MATSSVFIINISVFYIVTLHLCGAKEVGKKILHEEIMVPQGFYTV